MKRLIILLVLFQFSYLISADKTYGLAIYGPKDLKYKENEPYEHANVNAPKGGTIFLSKLGDFTTLNPFLSQNPADGLSPLVFQLLVDQSEDPDEPFNQYGLIAE